MLLRDDLIRVMKRLYCNRLERHNDLNQWFDYSKLKIFVVFSFNDLS